MIGTACRHERGRSPTPRSGRAIGRWPALGRARWVVAVTHGRGARHARRVGRLRRGGRAGQEGQATVELALLLPFVFGLLLLVVQVALVARDQLLLHHATREAARAIALEGDPSAAAGGRNDGEREDERFELTVEPLAEAPLFAVRGRYRSPVVVPLINLAREDVLLESRLVVRAEPS
jgi:hypothetical protein